MITPWKQFSRRMVAVVVSITMFMGALTGVSVGFATPAAAAGGTVDPDFSPGDLLNSDVYSVAPVTVGGVQKFLVGGDFTDAGAADNDYVVLLNTDGTVDSTFSPGGLLNNYVTSVAPVTVGGVQKFLVGGNFFNVGSGLNFRVVLLNTDGTVDSTFSPGGQLNNLVHSVVPVTVGGVQKFLVGGDFTNVGSGGNNLVVLMNENGTIDASFSPGLLLSGSVRSVAPVTVGGVQKFLVGGAFTNAGGNNRVVLLNTDGTVDTDFTPGNILNSTVRSVAPVTVGGVQKFLVGGQFTGAGGNNSLVLLNEDGTVDSTFSPGLLLSGSVLSVAPVTVGGVQKFLVGGQFSDAGDADNDYVVLLNADGSVDEDFAPGPLLNSNVWSVAPVTVGGVQKFLVGGQFTGAGDDGNNRVVLLNAPMVAPGVPGKPTAETGGVGQVKVTIAPSTTGDPAESYTVTSHSGGKTCTVQANVNPLQCTVSGLTPGATYTFTVVATNNVGPSPSSVASNAVKAGQSSSPKVAKPTKKPAKVKITGKPTASKWKVAWKKPSNTSKTRPATKYRLTVQLRGKKKIILTRNVKGSRTSTTLTRKQLLRAVRSLKLRGEVNARRYVFIVKVRAGNQAGNGPAAPARLVMSRR